jgi:hypothetical protein
LVLSAGVALARYRLFASKFQLGVHFDRQGHCDLAGGPGIRRRAENIGSVGLAFGDGDKRFGSALLQRYDCWT